MPGYTLAAKRNYYSRYLRTELKRSPPHRVEIPANIEMREWSAPCFMCGARAECRHRRHAD